MSLSPVTPSKVTLSAAFASFNEAWAPREGGRINDAQIRLAKLRGSFVWHHHEREDEMFLVVKGSMILHFRDASVPLNTGDYIIVPRGMEHCPEAPEECHVLFVEPADTVNTGNVGGERTCSVQSL
ncbi:cupin domain-containing protein [Rhodospirillum sp. A1_3_36]|uniref:cupin domain-containing protein n=1 Tax=Rhodospirillum sp. A1_3_36 TaxID=3391666 RepID=UPI0039A47670